ncbi:hypothetical protein B0T22DRAFT_21483 [Podospora appendiculata]|uniref:Peroxin 20 n=1 Tax=Podospora appendiculata TaxID=314037 RepID=A0AAE0XG37_9PEZI|nr:hypothetical protein B0T22DRAFT_21483 [Podospora appendiculata]
MADNMCGPSNGAKSLVSHADRDRALHQDRFSNAPQAGGSAAFRSLASFSHGADNAFESFQQGHSLNPAVVPTSLNPQFTMNHAAHQAFGHAVGGAPAAFNPNGHLALGNAGPGPVHAPLQGTVAHKQWVDQFANMQLGHDVVRAGPIMPQPVIAPGLVNHHVQQFPMPFNAPQFPMNMYGGAAPAFVYGQQNINFSGASQQSEVGLVTGDSSMDIEAFNRAFGDYDEGEFERELADWKQEELAATAELAEAQDSWMAQHGPRTEARIAQPPTAEEMVAIDANLEELAQELEERRAAGDPAVLPTKGPEAEARRRKREDDDLARAAVDILSSVSDNQSEKFKNSNFLQLMRRIGNREIVVEGTDLVDVESGEKVVYKETGSEHDSGIEGANLDGKGKDRADGQNGGLHPTVEEYNGHNGLSTA